MLLTTTEIVRKFEAGEMLLDDALGRLVRMGYRERDARLMLTPPPPPQECANYSDFPTTK